MKSLQASMILKNEEEMLPRALDSLKGIDSIMICDTGSTDSSFDIYEQYKKKPGYNLTWFKYSLFNADDHIMDFSHARNECKEKCIGDWIFILDGDEWFDFDLEKIKNIINSGWIKDHDVLLLDCKTEQEATSQPRVFRNIDTLWYFSEYHNTLMKYPAGRDKMPEMIPQSRYYKTSFIINAEFSPNHKIYPKRTLRIIRNVLKKRPNDARAMFYCAREILNQEDPNIYEALFWLLRYVEAAPPTPEMAEVFYLISTIYIDMELATKAVEYAFKCVELMPQYSNAWKIIHGMAHPQLKPYWEVMLKKSDNKGLMFVRK